MASQAATTRAGASQPEPLAASAATNDSECASSGKPAVWQARKRRKASSDAPARRAEATAEPNSETETAMPDSTRRAIRSAALCCGVEGPAAFEEGFGRTGGLRATPHTHGRVARMETAARPLQRPLQRVKAAAHAARSTQLFSESFTDQFSGLQVNTVIRKPCSRSSTDQRKLTVAEKCSEACTGF